MECCSSWSYKLLFLCHWALTDESALLPGLCFSHCKVQWSASGVISKNLDSCSKAVFTWERNFLFEKKIHNPHTTLFSRNTFLLSLEHKEHSVLYFHNIMGICSFLRYFVVGIFCHTVSRALCPTKKEIKIDEITA